ncbi:MAG: hypothetical protein H0X73_00300 [Chthoniobacterales bacterium]|nr:hypothetical protein [Chthoniobacterales bacterium]
MLTSDFIEQSFVKAGLHPRRHGYEVEGKVCDSIEAEIPGITGEVFIIERCSRL